MPWIRRASRGCGMHQSVSVSEHCDVGSAQAFRMAGRILRSIMRTTTTHRESFGLYEQRIASRARSQGLAIFINGRIMSASNVSQVSSEERPMSPIFD